MILIAAFLPSETPDICRDARKTSVAEDHDKRWADIRREMENTHSIEVAEKPDLALLEPSMRKLIALTFLALTLAAGVAAFASIEKPAPAMACENSGC